MGNAGITNEAPRESMLAATGAEDKKAHGLTQQKELETRERDGSAREHGDGDRGRTYSVDSPQAFCLESALICDRLAHSAQFAGPRRAAAYGPLPGRVCTLAITDFSYTAAGGGVITRG